LEALHAMYVAAPPIILSLLPKGVSIASKAIEPTTIRDIRSFILDLRLRKTGRKPTGF
jgi:hypothetical protein